MGSPERNTASEGSVWVAARKAGSQAPQNEKGQPSQAAPRKSVEGFCWQAPSEPRLGI